MAAKRLLVLDDEQDFGIYVQRVGERLGYDVTVLDRPSEFESAYQRVRPDTIMLDMVMPGMDGIEVIQWLIKAGNTAKVVICTGYSPQYAEFAESLAKSAGFFPIVSLTKPASLEALGAALEPEETTSR